MRLTDAQMRAIELILEQQDRFQGLVQNRMAQGIRMDMVVREFFEPDTPGAKFEMMVLNKIANLLVPDTMEDLNLVVHIPSLPRAPQPY